MCRGFETGSYLRLIDFVYHSTVGLRVIKKKEEDGASGAYLQEDARTSTRQVDASLPGIRNSNSHGARPVHLIIR